MKTQMSNFDVASFVKEAKTLAGLRLDKAFQPSYSEVWLRLSGKGRKATIVIKSGQILWFEESFLKTETSPSNFAMLLRKKLAGRILIDIRQQEFDRIIILDFSRENESMQLIIELFSKGNMIIVENGKIVKPMTSKSWRHRDLKAGAEYIPPPQGINPLELTPNDIEKIMQDSNKDLVRTLATELNLGGSYAEELCSHLSLDKKTPAKEIEAVVIKQIIETVNKLGKLLSEETVAVIKYEKEEVADVLPFLLSEREGQEIKSYESFNKALKEYFSNLPGTIDEDYEKSQEILRLERQIRQQEEAVKKLEEQSIILQKNGDAVYANYGSVEELLRNAGKVLEDNDWPSAKAEIEQWENVNSFNAEKGKMCITLKDGMELTLDVRKDVNENSSAFYEGVKKAKLRLEGAREALEKTKNEHKKTGKKEAKKKESSKIAPTKQLWYERYRWFISSEEFLVLGGRDARTNDKLVKKQLKDEDIYAHAEIQGAPSVVIKGGKEAGEATYQEACVFALSHSKAWKSKLASGSAYWVKPDQVSKTPQAGEFVPRGGFIIRGKRNYSKKLDIRLAIGEVMVEGERKVMCAPPNAVSRLIDSYFLIVPGETDKNKFAKRLSAHYNVPIEEILRILPPGDVKIIQEG